MTIDKLWRCFLVVKMQKRENSESPGIWPVVTNHLSDSDLRPKIISRKSLQWTQRCNSRKSSTQFKCFFFICRASKLHRKGSFVPLIVITIADVQPIFSRFANWNLRKRQSEFFQKNTNIYTWLFMNIKKLMFTFQIIEDCWKLMTVSKKQQRNELWLSLQSSK